MFLFKINISDILTNSHFLSCYGSLSLSLCQSIYLSLVIHWTYLFPRPSLTHTTYLSLRYILDIFQNHLFWKLIYLGLILTELATLCRFLDRGTIFHSVSVSEREREWGKKETDQKKKRKKIRKNILLHIDKCYITANLDCICLNKHEICTKSDAVQICGSIWSTL